MNHGLYVNLDNCLLNPYFESWFESNKGNSYYSNCYQNGFMIDKFEESVLIDGMILTKDTLMEVETIDSLGTTDLKLNKANISLNKIRF